jgi:hypothetical protein
MIEFGIWLPPILMVLGLYLLLKPGRGGIRIIGSLVAFFGGLLTIFEIWFLLRRHHP